MLEHELDEIYRLLLDDTSAQETKGSRSISDINYTIYMEKLRPQVPPLILFCLNCNAASSYLGLHVQRVCQTSLLFSQMIG